jgi:hypothetical protein
MVKRGYPPVRKRYAGKPTVPPHAGSRRCKVCAGLHTTNMHRFHGKGSFHRTHLFGFNPAIPEGGAFYFFGSFTSKIAAAKKERKHPGSFVHFKNGRYYVLKPKRKGNPSDSKRLVRIYGRVLSIQAQKTGFHRHCDAECKRVHHKYVHDFKPGFKLLGIPDKAALVLADGQVIHLSDGSMLVSDREY